MQMSSAAAENHSVNAPHGHFKPWALLEMPELTSAFRFVYPTLLVAAWDQAYLWDIPSGELIQTITEIQGTADEPGTLGRINYVELSSRHVFICGTYLIRIFSRASGKRVLDIPSNQFSYANWQYNILPSTPPQIMPGSVLVRHQTQSYFSPAEDGRLINEFAAGTSLNIHLYVH
jgi:hypothetical protein